jgi:hypothetical protein
MSWGTCYAGSNNIHFDFPPIMKDGRNYANWQPGGALNEEIRKENKLHSNWAYRSYLTEQADQIIRANQIAACDNCCSCPATYGNNSPSPPNNTPFLFKSCSDKTQPFGYENSDLKNLYLTDVQLQSRMVTPVLSQAQILQQGFARAN